jgi:hypothetical protein
LQGSERALEIGECLVDLEGLADALGALIVNAVVGKTARVKQGASTNCQPPADSKASKFRLEMVKKRART